MHLFIDTDTHALHLLPNSGKTRVAGGQGESEHGVMGRGDSDSEVICQEGLGSPRWEVVPEILRVSGYHGLREASAGEERGLHGTGGFWMLDARMGDRKGVS